MPRLRRWTLAALVLATSGCADIIEAFIPEPDPGATSDGFTNPDGFPSPDLPPRPEVDVAPSACSEDEDCAYLDDCCYVGWCYQGTCQLRYKASCCNVMGPCASTTPLHTAECVTLCEEGGCMPSLKLGDEGCGETLWHYQPGLGSEDELVVHDLAPADTVTWHLSQRRGLAGGMSMHAGDVACPTYHTGPLDAACEPLVPASSNPVSLKLATPLIDVPGGAPTIVRLWLWAELEPTPNQAVAFDNLELRVVPDGGYAVTRWSTRDHPLPPRAWTPVLVDISQHAGQSVSLELAFNTMDGVDNHYEGVYLGELHVASVCADDQPCPSPEELGPCGVGQQVPVIPLADSLCVTSTPSPGEACASCLTPKDCPLDDPCDVRHCFLGRCYVTHLPEPDCCTPNDVWPGPPSFEDELGEGFEVDPPQASARWHLSDLRAHSGAQSLRFGVIGQPGLALPGEAAAGVIWSPPMVLPAQGPAVVFATWISTEWDAAPSTSNPLGVDMLELLVSRSESWLEPLVAWTSAELGGTTAGYWQEVVVELDALAGLPVRLGFRFATGDDNANDGEGVYLDDVRVQRNCPPP